MEHTLTFSSRCRVPKIVLNIAVTAALAAAVLPLAGCGGSSSSSTSSPPANLQGSWGGGTSENPAVLTLTATGGDLALPCGDEDVFTQPLVANADGTFDVIATEHIPLFTPVSGAYPQIHLVGTVSGSTITIHEVFALGLGMPYTLTYGKAAPIFNGPCAV